MPYLCAPNKTYTSFEAPFLPPPFLAFGLLLQGVTLGFFSFLYVTGPIYDFNVWMSTVSNLLDDPGIEMPVFAPKVKKRRFNEKAVALPWTSHPPSSKSRPASPTTWQFFMGGRMCRYGTHMYTHIYVTCAYLEDWIYSHIHIATHRMSTKTWLHTSFMPADRAGDGNTILTTSHAFGQVSCKPKLFSNPLTSSFRPPPGFHRVPIIPSGTS